MIEPTLPDPEIIAQKAAPPAHQATMGVARGLLIIEMIGLLLIVAAYYFNSISDPPLWLSLPVSNEHLLIVTLFLLPASVLALVGVVGMFLLRTVGWGSAMLTQGMMLSGALLYYFRFDHHPGLLYLLMVYGIIMVLYLNSVDIRTRFSGTATSEPRSNL